jgi:hypothetical protein
VLCWTHYADVILTKLAWFRKRIWKAVLGKVVHLSIREFVISHQQAKPPFTQDGAIRGSNYKTCRCVTLYFVSLSCEWKTVLCSASVYLSCGQNFSFSIFCLAYKLIVTCSIQMSCVFVCLCACARFHALASFVTDDPNLGKKNYS